MYELKAALEKHLTAFSLVVHFLTVVNISDLIQKEEMDIDK